MIRGFVRGIADDSIRTILNDGPAHNQQWECLSAVTARAAKLATAKYGGKHSTFNSRPFHKKHSTPTTSKPFQKKWQHKSNAKPARRADTINKAVQQAINAALEDGTIPQPNMAAAMLPQPQPYQPQPYPHYMAAPAMHMGYGGGRRGGRGQWNGARGKRAGRGKRDQQEQQQEPGAAPSGGCSRYTSG